MFVPKPQWPALPARVAGSNQHRWSGVAGFEILLPLVPDKFAHVSSPSAGRLRIPKVIASLMGGHPRHRQQPASFRAAALESQGQDHGERDEADKVGVIMSKLP
jgi:hypothetical protein